MTPSRDAILLDILKEHKDLHLTVTSVRNEMLRREKSIKLDKATLRRWVNGKFKTLERRGLLEKHVDERGKARFLVLEKEDELLSEVVLRPRHPLERNAAPGPTGKSTSPLKQLERELEEYRLKAISQLGEIEEYKRIGETYPELRLRAEQKFAAALDENCRVLGKIRALEQLLSGRESS